MPMEASEEPGRSGMGGGSLGFSTKALTLSFSFTAMTPKAVACSRGTSMQPTVTFAPLVTWSRIICM